MVFDDTYAACFETLANTLRLELLTLLNKHEALNVTQLAILTGAERSRVSHALALLKQCRLITAEKHGRETRYRLNKETPLFTTQGDLFTLIKTHAKRCATCAKRL